ncbi:sigma-54 interaction domain-containing protein [Marininema halotolerans]|uniref:Arginine utilization regulatory protein n=1 Tax=Marininema halotolerans TaxID=1155944 RepID=A0A1I6P6Y7_9BACL|nr:sigma 54-interacting transcriptional regulator [Marininema halotolerans]SFS35915.1 arginine utilization regulatory protein [Marininema halotolerans]
MEPALSERMLWEVLHCIDEGIHVVDSKGFTVFYNHVAANLDGLLQGEVMGTHVLEAFPSLTPKTSTLMRVLETGEPLLDQRQAYTNRRGKRVVTVNSTLPLLVNGVKVGALEVAKDITRIQELSDKVIDLQTRIKKESGDEVKSPRGLYSFDEIITGDARMLQAIERGRKAAATRSPVLVIGETGTGKELLVQSIHSASPRQNRPFIAQNCAALPATLLEGILFGTTRGAFTGAEDRPGLFELAAGGTLFLDEVHAMPVDLQAKLLRALEDRVVRRVGDVRTRVVDVRIFAATNEPPEVSVKEGRLRKDLYYRLHVVRVQLPPLRERGNDVTLLSRHFLDQLNQRFGMNVQGFSAEVTKRFASYDWPGNVRELENVIEGAMNLVEGEEIELEHLPVQMESFSPELKSMEDFPEGIPLPERLSHVERSWVERALQECGGNVHQAAIRLGIPRQTLQYKLRKLQLIQS